MKKFYKYWFIFSLALITVLCLNLLWQSGSELSPQAPGQAAAHFTNVRAKAEIASNVALLAKMRISAQAIVPEAVSRVRRSGWVVPANAPFAAPVKVKSPKLTLAAEQKPILMPPHIPKGSVLINGAYAHPKRLIAKLSPAGRRARVLGNLGSNREAQKGLGELRMGDVVYSAETITSDGFVMLNISSAKEGGKGEDQSGKRDEPFDLKEAVLRGDEMQERIRGLKETGGFALIEPDYVVSNFQQATSTPSDSAFTSGSLWGLRNTGQYGGSSGIDIDAVRAWSVTTGSSEVIVAVIDTGIRYTHQDLVGQMWVNTDEIPNNGVDDDNDGYVDNVYGIDAINNDGDPMDDNNHGTHCAGTIGARANNGHPHVGVAWNVKLMACKFLSARGSGYTSGAIRCIDWAVANGAKVLSNSWGGGGYSQALYDSIRAAQNQGVLFVAAAGNSGQNADSNPMYPAAYQLDNIISVAAMNRSGNLASWSNYGSTSVDLAAPGVTIYSCTAGSNSSYANFSGTSMACPHVAGVSVLLLAKYPGATVDELRQRLLMTVSPMSNLEGRVASGGRVNANNALVGGEDGDLELELSASSNPLRGNTDALFYVRVTDMVPVAGATVTGQLTGLANLTFRDDGQAPDRTENDAVYTASYHITTDPQLETLTLEVSATAPGKNDASASANFTVIQPPANDDFAERTTLTGKYYSQIRGHNRDATRESGEPAHLGHSHGPHGDHSVWYTWKAKFGGLVEINTIGSNFDTILAVYTGSTLGSLSRIAANDDGGGNWTSRLTFNAVAGTEYQIAIDGYNWDYYSSQGDIRGEIVMTNEVEPDNDNFADALVIGSEETHTIIHGSNVGATQEAGEPRHGRDSVGKSTWWRWTPQMDAEVTLDSRAGNGGSNPFWAALGVYTGDAVDRLTPVISPSQGTSRFQARAGTTYYIAVDGLAWGSRPRQGSFRIILNAEPRPANDHFAQRNTLSDAKLTVLADNTHASRESGEPSHSDNRGGKSLWWTWTAPGDGTLKLDTTGSTLDTLLAVYTGDSLSNLSPLVSDDESGENHSSRVDLSVQEGTQYQIAVDGKYLSRWGWTDQGQARLSLNFVRTEDSPELGATVDAPGFAWQTGGNAHWFSQTDFYYSSPSAAQSGRIEHGDQTWVKVTLTGPGTLSFFWKVSSEADCDYLRLKLDGNEKAKISGDHEEQLSVDIPEGSHVIEWVYSKDDSVNGALDCGWLDQVFFNPLLPEVFTRYHENRDSSGRKWLTSTKGETFYINQDGNIYRQATSGDVVIARVGRRFYDDPRLLTWPIISGLQYHAERDEPVRKWFSGSGNNWYYITPNGQIFRAGNSSDQIVGRVDPSRFFSPQAMSRPAVTFVNRQANRDGSGRKWFVGMDAKDYFITPNGVIYSSDPAGESIVGGVDPTFYEQPQLLVLPRVTFAEYHQENDELGRRWVSDVSGNSGFITESGAIYRRNPQTGLNEPWAGVDPSRFTLPQLLLSPGVQFVQYNPDSEVTDKKWLKTEDGKSYYVDPLGGIYQWNDQDSTGTLIGGATMDRFQNPLLLLKPQVSLAEYSPGMDQPGRKWLKNYSGNWYFVAPSGGVYEHNEVEQQATLVGGVSISRYLEPRLLVWPPLKLVRHNTDYDETGRKWFTGSGGIELYVTAEGAMHESAEGALLGGVNLEAYKNPDLLVVPTSLFGQYHQDKDEIDKKWFTESTGDWIYIDANGVVYSGGVPDGLPLAPSSIDLAHEAAAASGDLVTKSLRFNRGDSPKLTRTFGTPTSQKKVTISFWIKQAEQADGSTGWCGLIVSGTHYTDYTGIGLGGGTNNRISGSSVTGGTYDSYKVLSRSLRDVGAWMHVCYVVDTTLPAALAADRTKFYINGVRDETFESPVIPWELNVDTDWSESGKGVGIGLDNAVSTAYFGGYLADFYYIDGQALDHTSFAKEAATTGQWEPIAYSGSGYGNNGFHLDFNDSTAIGNDVSGNGNHFNAINFTAKNLVDDVPPQSQSHSVRKIKELSPYFFHHPRDLVR